jgi:L-threonylcarbamoyladenylate synthase
LVLPKAAAIPAEVTAGGPTVAIRWPAHAFIQSVIQRCGFPLAAPSANLSTQTSPTLASHVQRALDGLVPIIVDGGPCDVGIESTVLDLTTAPPRVLRPGMVQESAVASVVGELQPDPLALGGLILKSPGLLARHYAPATPLWVAQWRDDQDLLRQLERRLSGSGQRPSDPEGCVRQVCVVAHTRIPAGFGWARLSVLPHQPATYARALYAELHACDALKPRLIVIEAVPESPDWRAVADRLRRAAGRS